MTDQQAEEICREYLAHIEKLELPSSVSELANLYTHDAWILKADHRSEENRLTLRIRCGDNQKGYSDACLIFSGASVDSEILTLLQKVSRPSPYEILYQEVDRIDNEYRYSFILHPAGEVSIRFRDVQIVTTPVADRHVE